MSIAKKEIHNYDTGLISNTKLEELCSRMEERQLQKRNRKVALIEFNPEGYITNIRNFFLDFIGYQSMDFLGKHFSEVLENCPITPKGWNEILSGKESIQTLIVNTKENEKHVFKFHFEACINDNDVPFKVLMKTDQW